MTQPAPQPGPQLVGIPHRAQHREVIPGLPSYAGRVRYGLDPVPRQIRLEITTRCPNTCPWCHFYGGHNPIFADLGPDQPRGKIGHRPPDAMPLAMIERALKEIASWTQPLPELTFNNYNEIWTHPEWPEALALVDQLLPHLSKGGGNRKFDPKFVLVTTGTMMTDEIVEKIARVRSLKYINFSINAFFQETYQRIHGVSAKALLRAQHAIARLRIMRPDIWVNVSMVYDPTLVTEIERELFRAYWTPLVNAVEVQNPSYAKSPLRRPAEPVTLPCRSIFDGLVIDPSGHVGTACCFDGDFELEVGHWPEQSLLEIWSGEKLRELGRLHNEGRRTEIDLCSNCTFA